MCTVTWIGLSPALTTTWIYTLKLFDELACHASGADDLARLCAFMTEGRLDGRIELEASWRDPARALDAFLERRIGGKAVLHVDRAAVPIGRQVSPAIAGRASRSSLHASPRGQ